MTDATTETAPAGDSTPADTAPVVELTGIERDRAMIVAAKDQGPFAKLWAYTKLSGPGWLQSAITLGGGSLGGSLYLGVLAGFGAMFWQPLAMVMGIVMLSAIGYVTLSTGERPFDAINKHVNPVLGWGWAIATLMANLVWCMPQYALGMGAVQQNLGVLSGGANDWYVAGILFVVTGVVIVCYDAGGIAVKVFDWVLKGMVGVVVVSFFIVVGQLSLAGELEWGKILAGFVPDITALWRVSPEFSSVLGTTGDFRGHWEELIRNQQRNAAIASAATAVGINMTFLLPYSMLRKGWDREFRGLAIFDLSTGLFIPYLLATSCVVIASASAFHATEAPGLVREDAAAEQEAGLVANPDLVPRFNGLLDGRLTAEHDGYAEFAAEKKDQLRTELPEGDRRVAAMIVKRDNADFAASLSKIGGGGTAQTLFGVGVLGMAVSTIIILMLINGFVLTEICNQSGNKALHLMGCFMASIFGMVGAKTLWVGDARAYLTIPTSNFGMVLLPIAYITFLLMMNSKSLLGENKPKGLRLLAWNVPMVLATAFATFCCLWKINSSKLIERMFGFGALGVFVAAVVIVHFVRSKPVGESEA